ncbi:MAG: GMC oxidoreductase [Solirubrobacteraceae bacterium]
MRMRPLERFLLTPLSDLAETSVTQPWDAVVVGAGAAGLSAARALVECGRRVAVIDGGPLVLLTHASTTDLRFDGAGLTRLRAMLEYSPRNAGGGSFGHLIGCVGGRALFWNGAAPRFAARDFAVWPLSLGDLAPYYEWAERDLRVTRDFGAGGLGETVCRLLRESGLPAEQGPYAVDTQATRDGWIGGTVGNPVASLLRAGLLTAEQPRLRVAARSFARRMLLGGDGRVAGVAVSDLDVGSEHELRSRSVVLAAGGLESVRLAMASALPDRSGRLGKGIVDHLFCRAYHPVSPMLYDPNKPEAAIVAVPADESRAFQLEIHMPSDDLFAQSEYSVWEPSGSRAYSAMVRSFAPLQPREDCFVELGSSDEPGDYTVHFSYSKADLALLDAMAGGIEQVGTALKADRLGAVERFSPGDSHHEAGGMAMGADPSTAVCDPFGRSYAVPNVVVADASAWPTVSAANPCLTITALARRQAEQLDRDLGTA